MATKKSTLGVYEALVAGYYRQRDHSLISFGMSTKTKKIRSSAPVLRGFTMNTSFLALESHQINNIHLS